MEEEDNDNVPLLDPSVPTFLIKELCILKQNEEYCDLVFELSGAKFFAHRLVLVAWSPIMKTLLDHGVTTVQHVRVLSDQHEAFQIFLNFLYSGELENAVSNMYTVLLLASSFQIQALRNLCENHLISVTILDNVIGYFHLAVKFQLANLEAYCVRFLRDNLADVVQRAEFRDLTPEQFNTFLASCKISRLNPELKLFLIISWLSGDVCMREQYLVLLLGHLDWEVVAKDFLLEISQTENFFTSNPSSLYLLLQTLHSASITLGPYTDQFEALREQFCYLLSSVVTSIVDLGSGRYKVYHPVGLSLITPKTSVDSDNHLKCNSQPINEDTASSHLKIESFEEVDSKDYNTLLSNVISHENVEESCTELNDFEQGIEKLKRKSFISSQKSSGSLKRKHNLPQKLRSTDKDALKDSKSHGSVKRKKKKSDQDAEITKSPAKETNHLETLPKSDRKGSTPEKTNASPTLVKTGVSRKTRTDESKMKKVVRKSPRLKEEDESSVIPTNVTSDDKTVSESSSGGKRQHKVPLAKMSKKTTKSLSAEKKAIRLNCSLCSYKPKNKTDLEKHMEKIHQSLGIYQCQLCKFECQKSKDYNDHLKSIHFQGPPFICDTEDCQFSSDKLATLLTHRRQHSDDRPYVCESCNMGFRTRNNLYAHNKCHSDEKNFQCPDCDRSFKLKNTLDQHMVIHSDLRPYLCDLCGFSTKFQSHLIAHKKIHTGDVFNCTFPSCNYTTPKRSQLQAHMRSHLGIRQHACTMCDKTFIEKSHLTRHKRSHSSVKAHKCNECDYASARLDKLKEHLKKHEKASSIKKTAKERKRKKSPSDKTISSISLSSEIDAKTSAVLTNYNSSIVTTNSNQIEAADNLNQEISSHTTVDTVDTKASLMLPVSDELSFHQNKVVATGIENMASSVEPLRSEADMTAVEFIMGMDFNLTDIQQESISVPSNSQSICSKLPPVNIVDVRNTNHGDDINLSKVTMPNDYVEHRMSQPMHMSQQTFAPLRIQAYPQFSSSAIEQTSNSHVPTQLQASSFEFDTSSSSSCMTVNHTQSYQIIQENELILHHYKNLEKIAYSNGKSQ